MTPSVILLNIIGGVCLLLWGLRGVKNGMNRAFGAELHHVISKSTGNRFSSFLSGIGVTALVQSSTATALIVAAFCGQGMMTTASGLAVMLGADVGTTIVAQFLSFDLNWLAPVLVVSGYLVFMQFRKKGRGEHVGKFLIGLGLMLFSLMWIRESAEPLKESETLAIVLQSLQQDPIFALLIAAVVTWVMHSSLAMVLLLMSLMMGGVLPLMTGLVMVLGANIGGALIPFFVTLKNSAAAARVPLGNLMIRFTGVLCIMPFVEPVANFMLAQGLSEERLLVDFHMAFNIVLALFFLPFTGPLARLCEKLMPEKVSDEDQKLMPRYLDEKELDTTSVALSAAVRETLRMADVLQNMVEDTIKALRENNTALIADIRKRDDVLDNLYREIKLYMAKITHESLDPDESLRYMQILSFASNIENAGDTIDKSMMEMAQKKIKDKLRFSESGWEDIEEIHNFVRETMRQASSMFVSGDINLARTLVEEKEKLRLMEKEATEAHFQRIREGVPETIATSALHLDILRDYRRLNSYIIALAYPLLEQEGQLKSSRLRKVK